MSLQSQLEVILEGKDNLSPVFKGVESQLIRTVGAIASFRAAITTIAFPITEAASFEREVANVVKTTNFSTTQVNELSQALLKLSTQVNVSAVDLAKIAAAAGQQGLGRFGVDAVVKFTDSVARMASVLDLSAADAATAVGKIINVFKLPIGDVERISAAFNNVSNNSTAKGAELLDIVKRIGDAAGALNLQQTLGLAATGLDLGINPEVIGSSFNRIFGNLSVHAKELSQLLNRDLTDASKKLSPDDFIKKVKTDGVAALQDVIKALANTKSSDQVTAIQKLLGADTRGQLFQKLIADQQNGSAILERDQKLALQGYQDQTSSIREQITVLSTLTEQSKILGQTVSKVAIDFANFAPKDGEGNETGSLISKITSYVVELREELKKPAVQQFLEALARGFGKLVDGIAFVVKGIGDLGINFQNFIALGTGLALLKIVDVTQSLFLRLGLVQGAVRLVGGEYQKLAQSARSAAEAEAAAAAAAEARAKAGAAGLPVSAAQAAAQRQAAINAAGVAAAAGNIERVAQAGENTAPTGFFGRTLENNIPGLAAYKAGMAEAKQARIELAAVEAEADAAAVAQTKAINDQLAAETKLLAEQAEVRRTGAVFTAARRDTEAQGTQLAGFTAGRADLDKAVVDAQKARVVAIEASETEHALRMQTIDNVYNEQLLTKKVANSRAEKAILDETYAEQQAAEEARFTRSITQVESYYGKQIVAAETYRTETLALVEDEIKSVELLRQASYSRQLTARAAFDEAVIARQTASTEAALAAEGTQVAGAGAAAAAGKLGAVRDVAATADSPLRKLGLTLGLVAGAFGALIRVASAAFLPLFLLYTVLDSFGVIDKLPAFFQRFTDAIGITSEATRKLREEEETRRNDQEKSTKVIRDQIQAYDELIKKGASVGKTPIDNVNSIADRIKNAKTSEDNVAGLKDFATVAVGAQAASTTASDVVNKSPASREANLKLIAQTKADLDSLNAQLKAAEAEAQQVQFDALGNAVAGTGVVSQTLQDRVTLTAQTYDKLKAKELDYQAGLADSQKTQAANTLATLNATATRAAGIFTDQTEKVLAEQGLAVSQAQAALDKALADAKAKGADLTAGKKGAELEAGKAAEKALLAEASDNLQPKLAEAQKKFAEALAPIQNAKGVPQEVINSILQLQLVVNNFKPGEIEALLASLRNARTLNIPLTGKDATPAPTKPKDAPFQTPKEGELERITKAQIALARATAQAQQELSKATNDVQLADLQRLYDRGLVAVTDFYNKKRQVIDADAAAETRRLGFDLAASLKAQGKNAAEVAALRKTFTPQENAALNKVTPLLKEADKINENAKEVEIRAKLKIVPIQSEEAKRAANDAQALLALQLAQSNLEFDVNAKVKFGTNDFSTLAIKAEQAELLKNNYAINRYRTAAKEADKAGDELGAQFNRQRVAVIQLSAQYTGLQTAISQINTESDLLYGKIDRAGRVFSLLAQQGELTDNQLFNLNKSARDAAVPELTAKVQQLTAQLGTVPAVLSDGSTNLEFAKISASIDDAKIKLLEFQNVNDQVAQNINRSLTDAFQQAFNVIDGGGDKTKSFGEQLKAAALGFVTTVRDEFNKGLAQSAVQGLFGQSGNGGAGGFLSGILRTVTGNAGPAGSAAAGAAQDPSNAGTAGGFVDRLINNLAGGTKRGESALSPLFVSDVNKTADATGNAFKSLLGNGANKSAKLDGTNDVAGLEALDSAAASAGDKISDSLTDKLGGVFGTLGTGLSSIFKGVGGGLDAVISGVGGFIRSLFGGGAGGSTDYSALLSSAVKVVASFFHGGGTAGSTNARTASFSPTLFANAQRFHEGLPGLKADEFPAILQQGEKVSTVAQQLQEAREKGSGTTIGDQTNHISINIDGSGGGVAEASPENQAQLAKVLTTLITDRLHYERRPGGLLAPTGN